MTTSALLPLKQEVQRRLARLLAREGCEVTFLREVLELWCEDQGVSCLAAYLPHEDGWEAAASFGPCEFPAVVSRAGLDDWWSRKVGEAALVSPDPLPGGNPDEPLGVLLAAGLRLARYRSRLKQRDFDDKYRGVALEAIYDVGLAIASTLDLDALTEEILLRAVALLDARRGALYLVEGEGFRLHRTIGGSAQEQADAAEAGDTTDLLPGSSYALTVPIEIEEQRRGLLAVADKESRVGVGPFTDADRRSLAHFANQAALALEQARLHQEALEKERLEREMELASEIQRGILPRDLPDVPGYEIRGWTRPARHVGGDFYDLVPTENGRLAMAVADVSGKGVPAALLVSTVHALLRSLLGRGIDFPELCEHLNRHLLQFSASNKFVTLLLVELDPETGAVHYVNAGHNPAVLVRAGSDAVEEIRASSVPLGILPDETFGTGEIVLQSGDLLCLYSDGVTEAESPDFEEFGLERLAHELAARRDHPLESIHEGIDRLVRRHSEGQPQGDDQTMLLIRRVP